MSDITKKIFSIEQTQDVVSSVEPTTSDIIRPLSDDPIAKQPKTKVDKIPEFVTREAIEPLSSPPTFIDDSVQPSKAPGWIILGFGLLYLIGAGLYFGLPLISAPIQTLSIAGLVLILVLPLFLLFLLWRSLRHLNIISQQNTRLSKAAAILVSPNKEALAQTESLASGIQGQISNVNKEMSLTVEALKGVQIAMTRESQALDAAGLALSNRSDDVGRNLTLQRQALESMSGTFDTRITSLSNQITESGKMLDDICASAETKLLTAGEALEKTSTLVDEKVTSGAAKIGENITSLEETNRKLNDTANTISTDLSASTEILKATDNTFAENSGKFADLTAQTNTQISDLQATIGHGYEMLSDLKAETEARALTITSFYDELSGLVKRSEDETLIAQGKSAEMVQSNIAQTRRDFSRMETELQSLQSKLNNLRHASDEIPAEEPKPNRLNLMPLETDFPPVEPPRFQKTSKRVKMRSKPVKVDEVPLNLGMDMEIESANEPMLDIEPDVIRRPGAVSPMSKSKGFGRRPETTEKSGWRWRDMLGALDRPESSAPPAQAIATQSASLRNIDGVALLTGLKLSPAAIVDEGTVIDATQARINNGESGLTSVVIEKLPEAISHLKEKIAVDTALKANLRAFTDDFAQMIGNTPPTAPELRAAFGSPEGRAYLLCAAAFKPELRR